jgi:HlyD family secretion protein
MAAVGLTFASCKQEKVVELETYTVAPVDITEVVTATGTMESVTQVDVGTQVTGIIDKLYADYNDQVTKGQLIAEIEKTLLESDLKSADASLASSKASYEYAKTNYERDKALNKEQLISDYEFQTTKKEYELALSNYEKAQADRVRAAKNLNYAEIYSPIDGIVISREVEVGQTVVSSMNVANMYVIADLDNMQVVGNVDEADIGKVKEGQNVTFTVDAYTDDTFTGTVTQVRLNPTTESNVVTYEVIVAAANPDHKLIPGMTANLTIYTTELPGVTALPMKAFKFTPQEFDEEETAASNLPTLVAAKDTELGENEMWVYVVNGNKLVQTKVETGVSNGIYRQILSGIKVGDKVAVDYNEVTVKEANADADTTENPFMPKPPGSNKDSKKSETKN